MPPDLIIKLLQLLFILCRERGDGKKSLVSKDRQAQGHYT